MIAAPAPCVVVEMQPTSASAANSLRPATIQLQMLVGVEVRVKAVPLNLVGGGLQGQDGASLRIDQRELGVGLADIEDDGGVGARHGVRHSMWKTFSRAIEIGSLVGWVAMMSAI